MRAVGEWMGREKQPFSELVRLFFRRFLENDLICLDGDTKPALVNILALLAAPGVFFPVLELLAYAAAYQRPFYVRDMASIPEKALYLCFSMTALGIATVLEWDTLVPDRRDYAVLRPLPLRLGTILAAKIAAVAGFWGILTLVINAFATVVFPIAVVQNEGFTTLIRFIGCHALAVLAGNAFIFLAILSVQGLLMNVLGWRGFRRASPYAQSLLIVALLMMLFTSLTLAGELLPGRPASSALRFFPPFWFVGLYQNELGWTQPIFRELAAQAKLALGIAAVTGVAAFALSYRRHAQRSLESLKAGATAPGRLARALTAFTDRVVLRTAGERASFHFVRQTLLESRKHRGLLGAWVGVGLALVSQSLAGLATSGRPDWWQNPQGALLPAPLVLSFFLLCGMRYVFTVPAERRANWVFRIAGSADINEYMGGIRKAVILTGILPLFALLLPVYVVIWGWRAASLHILFGCIVAYLLMDVLLAGFAKVPFTCSYVPGKANLKTCWWLYVGAFAVYFAFFTSFEYLILEQPSRMLWLLIFAAALKTCTYLYRRHLEAEDFAIVFDEVPEPAVQTLNIQGF